MHEDEGGLIPKVIANRMLVLPSGEWILPYWRERPRWEHIAEFPNFQSNCYPPAPSKYQPDAPASNATEEEEAMTGTSAGVLVSRDSGNTWYTYGNLSDPRTGLIEGTVAQIPDGRLLMYLRSNTGCTFQSISGDRGRTWDTPEPANLPNPNSKLHMVRLQPSGYLAVVFNNHHRSSSCRNCRTHLHIVISKDNGASWRNVATIEDSMETNVRIHYPTMLQVGQKLYVAYSRFFLGKCRSEFSQQQLQSGDPLCPGLVSENQGIKLAEVDISSLEALPQMKLVSDTERKAPNRKAVTGMMHHFVKTEIPRNMESMPSPIAALGIINKLKVMKWKDVVSILTLIYDLDYLGGAKFLRKRQELADAFHTILNVQGPFIKESYLKAHGITSLEGIEGDSLSKGHDTSGFSMRHLSLVKAFQPDDELRRGTSSTHKLNPLDLEG